MRTKDIVTDLLLWRHAEAEPAGVHLPDLKRRLTVHGEKQARTVAIWLRERQPKHLHILVSPAERCQQTAHALAQRFEMETKIGPTAGASEIMQASGWPLGGPHRHAVLVVGHQPALGRLAALLLCGQEADWTIKKGALWWFSGRTREGRTETVLRAVIAPEMV